uniref:Uncharacterized protein n=1 Tax=Biomphalaria glabrata TaxID=6526 RepID=A0A2C9KDK8_BIOGL
MQGGAARSSSVILEDFSGEFAGGDLNMINLASAGDGETLTRQSLKETPRILLEGRGGHMMHPKLLLFNHFKAVIIKRFHYITRNWRSLFSQIILPAIFVAIAMTVALAAPSVDDLPPLELSPVQYTNVSLPNGNFIPFTNERLSRPSSVNPLDADAYRLQASLTLPSGVGSSCLLQFPNISSNFSTEWSDFEHSCQWLVDKYRQMHAEPNFYYFDHWNFSIPYTDCKLCFCF